MMNQPITIPPIELDEKGNLDLDSIKIKEINFGKSFHPEFSGYIVEQKGGVWISVIESKEIGRGNFSRLIKEFKEKYSFIKIPTPSKMMIERALHLGFEHKIEFFREPFNEKGTLLFWEKGLVSDGERT